MSTPQPQAAFGDELTNIGIGVLISAAGLAVLLRSAGAVAAWATGIGQPAGGPASGLAVIFDAGNPAAALHAPGLSPIAFWVATIVMLALVLATAFWL